MKLKYERKAEELKKSKQGESSSVLNAKLPKLSITKFDGTYLFYLDWARFWGQFTEAVDKSGIAAITKFSYLKEFVDRKVRKTIDRRRI